MAVHNSCGPHAQPPWALPTGSTWVDGARRARRTDLGRTPESGGARRNTGGHLVVGHRLVDRLEAQGRGYRERGAASIGTRPGGESCRTMVRSMGRVPQSTAFSESRHRRATHGWARRPFRRLPGHAPPVRRIAQIDNSRSAAGRLGLRELARHGRASGPTRNSRVDRRKTERKRTGEGHHEDRVHAAYDLPIGRLQANHEVLRSARFRAPGSFSGLLPLIQTGDAG